MATLGSAPSESTVGDGPQQPVLLRSMHDHIDNAFPMTKRIRLADHPTSVVAARSTRVIRHPVRGLFLTY